MDGPNYPTKVEVRRSDLRQTETSKAFHILQRFVDVGQPGVVSGLTVQQSSTGNDRFDMLAGFGYAPNGEFIELPTTLESQAVVGAAGLPQLAGLMYREFLDNAGAAETDGIARERSVRRDVELKIFTDAEFDALPDSFDQDLSIDAKDRFLICAVVELIGSTTNPLTITLPPTFDIIKTIQQPSEASGIVILNIDETTPNSDPFPAIGTPDQAELVYEPSTSLLGYKAPQDGADLSQASPFDGTGMGVPVDVSAGGTFVLTSANGVNTCTVIVDTLLLPTVTSASVTDSLEVTPVYFPTAQRNTAKDDWHRHKIGGQVPSNVNPHGVRFSDIATLFEELIGTLRLGTAYTSTLAQGEIPTLVWPANTTVDAASGDSRFQFLAQATGSSNLFGASASPMNIRVYRSGFDSLHVLLNARYRNSGTLGTIERLLSNGDNPDAQAALIELSPFAIVTYAQDAASADTWDTSTWDRVQMFHSFSSNRTTFDGKLIVDGNSNSESADFIKRIRVTPKDGFQWATPQTFKHWISGNDFQGDLVNPDNVQISWDGKSPIVVTNYGTLAMSPNTSFLVVTANASIRLPQGATLVSATWHGFSNSASLNHIGIIRQAHDLDASPLAQSLVSTATPAGDDPNPFPTVTLPSTGTGPVADFPIPVNQHLVIDNDTWKYMIKVVADGSGAQLFTHSVVFEYTLPAIQPA
jgi:hypothetical protein